MPLEKFKTDVWKTAGARFNAYRRLRKKQNASIFCISFLSLFNIAIAMFEIIPKEYNNNASILFSVFIIMVSLLEFSKGYGTKAERMHVNAMQLTDFNKSLELETQLTQDLLDKYQHIKNSCAENHESYDVELFQLQHRGDFYKEDTGFQFWNRKWGCKLNSLFHTYIIYGFLIACTVGLFFIPS